MHSFLVVRRAKVVNVRAVGGGRRMGKKRVRLELLEVVEEVVKEIVLSVLL